MDININTSGGFMTCGTIDDTKKRDDIGSPTPAYLPNTDEPPTDFLTGGDLATTSAPTGGARAYGATGGTSDTPDPEYLDNSSLYQSSLDGGNSAPTGTPAANPPRARAMEGTGRAPAAGEPGGPSGAGSTGGSSGTGTSTERAGDSMNTAQSSTTDLMNGLDGQDFIVGEDGEYKTINGEKLADIMAYLAKMTELEMEIKMLTEAQGEISEKMMEILLQLKPEEGDSSADASRDAFFKSMKGRMTIIEQFMSSIYKAVYTQNFALYKGRIQDLEDAKNNRGFWGDVGNFLSGGQDDIDTLEAERDETAKFNQSISANLEQLMRALEALAMACSSMGGEVNLGIASVLREFNNRIGQAQTLMDGSDFFDDSDVKNFLQDILTEVRQKMVALENTGRAETYLQTAQMEESQAIMEIVLDLTPHASRAEYAYFGGETISKLSNMFFDAAFNTLTTRIQFYNQEITIQHNIDKMKAAQGWRIAGLGLVVIAIVVAVATYGSCSWLPVVVVGALSAGGAAMTSTGTYMASQVNDHYDMVDPNFTLGTSAAGGAQPRNVVEAMDYAESQEESLINSMGSQDLMVKGKDGFYTVDVAKMTSFSLKLHSLQNLSKMIAYLNKAMRDISRALTAIIMEFAVKDFGDGYLLGNLDNTIQQQQLVMQSIQLQVQDQVMGKNIARQNEIMASKAFGAAGCGIAGMVIGLGLSFIPGLGAYAGILMSLGSAIGSSTYQILDLELSDTSSLHNDANEINTNDLQNVLDQRNRNAVNSGVAEDKLTGLENGYFSDLMANGYVSTGDGYHGVDFALVGRIYSALMKIQDLRVMLSELRQGQFRVSSAIRQQVMGTGTSDLAGLDKIMVQGSFNQAMEVLQGITKFIGEKAQIMNRQRDSEKQLEMAIISGSVSVAISGIGAAGVGGAFGQGVAQLAGTLTPAVSSLVTSACNLYLELNWASNDFGDYKKYQSDPEKVVKDINGNARKADSDDSFDQLDDIETQVYREAGENLATTLTGASWVEDGQMTGILNSRLHALSNLRKMLATLITAKDSLSSLERRNLRAGGAQGIDELMELSAARERTAQNVLNCLVQGIDIIIERHNQMSQAQREAVMTVTGMVLNVAIAVVSACASMKSGELSAVGKELKSLESKLANAVTPGAEGDASAADAAPAASDAGASQTPADSGASQTPADSGSSETPAASGTDVSPAAQGASATAPGSSAAPAAAGAGAEPAATATSATATATTATAPGTSVTSADSGKPVMPAGMKAAPKTQAGQTKDGKVPEKFNKNEVAKQIKDLKAKYDKLDSTCRKYQIGIVLGNAANMLLTFYSGKLFDEAQSSKKSSVNSSALDANRTGKNRHASQGKTEQSSQALSNDGAADNSSGGGIFDTIDGLDTDAEQADVLISKYSTQSAGEMTAQLGEQMAKTWLEALKEASGAAKYIKKDGPTPYQDINKNTNAAPSPTNPTKAEQDWQDKLSRITDPLKNDQITWQKAQGQLDKELKVRPEFQKHPATQELRMRIAEKAAAASLSPKVVAPPPPTAVIIETPKQQSGSQTNTLEYAKKLIADFEVKNQEAAQKIATTVAQNSPKSTAAVARDGEQPALSIDEQLAAAQRAKTELLAKQDGLFKTLNTMKTDLESMKDQAAKVIAEAEDRMAEIDEATKPGASGLTADAQAKLRDQKKLHQTVEPRMVEQLKSYNKKIDDVKQAWSACAPELKNLNKEISTLTREKEKLALGKKDGRTIGAAASKQPQVQGVASAGLRLGEQKQKETSLRNKMQDAVEADKLAMAAMSQSGGSRMGGGFSC